MTQRSRIHLSEQSQRGWPRSAGRRWVVIAVVAVLSTVAATAAVRLMLGLLAAAALHSAVTDTESLSRAQIESIGQFRFPPGATDVRSRYVSWMDFTLQVKFALPPAEVGALLDSTRIHRPLSSTQPTSWSFPPARDANDWWRPGTPAAFEAGASVRDELPFVVGPQPAAEPEPATQPAPRQFILIDKTDPRHYTVWLYVSE